MIGYLIVFVIIPLTFLFVVGGIILYGFSIVYNKRDREMRNEAEAHRKILESTYDHIWNEIKRRCGLNESHRRSFNNVYPNLIDKDIDDDTMLNWILDCNIDFNPEEYPVIMENIADDRQRFVTHQRRMLSIMREHREMHNKRIAQLVIKNKTAIRYVPIQTNYDRWGSTL